MSKMIENIREKVVKIISTEIRKSGFVWVNQLTHLLEKNGEKYGINRSLYGVQGPKRWIESNFPEFFVDCSNGNGKEIIVFSYIEEKISCKSIFDSLDNNKTGKDYRIGVIAYYNKNAFINPGYDINKSKHDDLSVIFIPNLIQTIPESFTFDTKTNIYLVCYAVSGTVKNSKNGMDHPAFDYTIPIRVISSLPRNECEYIRILSEEVIIGRLFDIHQKEDLTNHSNSNIDIDKLSKKSVPDSELFLLDEFFDAGRYADYLSSDIIKRVQPQELPIEYMEKALTCAYRLVYPESKSYICLNDFQRELLLNPTTSAFVKKWKQNGVYSGKIVEQCGETAIAHLEYPKHTKLILNLLNAVGEITALNNNYVGITERFVACENELIPLFYIIRAFVINTSSSIQNIIDEYCIYVKDMKHSNSRSRMSDEANLYSFHHILRIIHNHIMDLTILPQNIRTNIVSVFMEYDKLNELKKIISLWDKEAVSIDWRLIDLYSNPDEWDEDNFIQLLNDGINKQLLQRCLAFMWRNACSGNIIKRSYLRILSWVIIHDGFTSIEEIIRYPSGKEINKIDKQNMLINSYKTICDNLDTDINMYILVSYIIFFLQDKESSNELSVKERELLDDWSIFSNSFYTKITTSLGNITFENEKEYISLFAIFKLDIPHYSKLQAYYAEWFIKSCDFKDMTIDKMDCILDNLYSEGCYAAFVDLFSEKIQYEYITLYNKQLSHYVMSLVFLHRYTEAISSLWNSTSINVSDRNSLLIRAIGENFRYNGLTNNAFSFLADESMRKEIITLLLSEFQTTQPLIINSLISLYIHENKYMNAAYLFAVYNSKVDKGFARLYKQIRIRLGKYVNLEKYYSNYHVIELAFSTLNSKDLIEFIIWAGKIKIPNFKNHIKGHYFKSFYDNLLANSSECSVWVSFLDHLVKYGIEKNAWNICVCETILCQYFNYHKSSYSEQALVYYFKNNKSVVYPPNFLAFTFAIIMNNSNSKICHNLVEILADKDIYQQLYINNIWTKKYKNDFKEFIQFCHNAYVTENDSIYHEVLSYLCDELTIHDLKESTKLATSKQVLFSRACYNYLNECNIKETAEVLFSDDWGNMSDNDREVLDILRLIFSDDNILLLDSEGLFSDEYTVHRFKHDCAEIISTYPEKEGLFIFDKTCNNESYKMLVYSYVFPVIYDQDIYESLDKQFSDFTDELSYKIYLRFLSCSYKAQSIRNTTFPFFYKKWRYLKLYLSYFLRHSESVNDSDILLLMEKNGHYDEVYADSYVPFVETVKCFMELDGLSQEFKKHFLFAVMVSHAEDLYDTYAQTMEEMAANHTFEIYIYQNCKVNQ